MVSQSYQYLIFENIYMNKNILIIGANSPAAIETARHFLKKKNRVIAISKNNLTSENKKQVPNLTDFKKIDITLKTEFNDFFNKIIKKYKIVHSIIFFQRDRSKNTSLSSEVRVSIEATIKIIEIFSKQKEISDKTITIISSPAANKIASEQGINYHISKAGINQVIRYYAVKLGKKNIRVNGVEPAIVIKERSKKYFSDNLDLTNLYEKTIPLGRMGTVIDIAQLIYFLSSKESSYINGQIIKIDGGLSLHEAGSLSRLSNEL